MHAGLPRPSGARAATVLALVCAAALAAAAAAAAAAVSDTTVRELLDDALAEHGTVHGAAGGSIAHYNHTALARAWCSHLRAAPSEPVAVLYPRIPKAGSTSMKGVLREAARGWAGGRRFVNLGVEYWNEDYSSPHTPAAERLRERAIEEAREAGAENGVVLVGHLGGAEFTPEMVGAPNLEIFNVMRDCTARLVSNLFYTVFTEFGNAFKHRSTPEYRAKALGLDNPSARTQADVDACARDVSCVERAMSAGSHASAQSKYVCGGSAECAAGGGRRVARAIERLGGGPAPFLTSFGVLDDYEASIRVLECALPRTFRGRTDAEIVHSNKSTKPDAEAEAMKRNFTAAAAKACAGSEDKALVAFAREQLAARDALITADGGWEACCRPRPLD